MQYRWFVVVDLHGRVQYVSQAYYGRQSDEDALVADKRFTDLFSARHSDGGKNVPILGDRGYRRQSPIGTCRFGITKSGETSQNPNPVVRSGVVPPHLTPDATEAAQYEEDFLVRGDAPDNDADEDADADADVDVDVRLS